MDSSPTTDTSRRIVRIVIVTVVAFVALLLLWPGAQERLAPQPVRAHVAILPEGAERAVVGPVRIEPGAAFTLHAVLEAEGRGDTSVYYTEAPGLEIGGETLDGEELLRWDRPQVVKLRWFTVEGPTPYMELETAENLDRFAFTEFFRPDLPATWAVPGRVDSRYDQNLAHFARTEEVLGERRTFGTQRYQVRIELYDDEKGLIPDARFTSLGGAALPGEAAVFPTVHAAFAGPAGPASLAFGLTQIEPPSGPAAERGSELMERLSGLTARRLAYARLPLIREVLAEADTARGSLSWHEVNLNHGPAWGDGPESVERGDLLRAGGRVVVLYEDRGAAGRLDRQDLCFDYVQGAAVLPVSEVFVGEGLLELARL